MKEYFSHDYNARNDIKLKKLFMQLGLQGIGLYWCLVEMLYEKGGYVELDYIPIIAFDLRIDESIINSVIDEFDLFEKNETHFYSESIIKRLQIRQDKSEKAKNSANARWSKYDSNTNEMQTQCKRITNEMQTDSDCNAKENKIKENKSIVKISIDDIARTPARDFDEEDFADDLKFFLDKWNITIDDYNCQLSELYFKALDKAYSGSKWLRDNFKVISKVCKHYLKIISGSYDDKKEISRPTSNGATANDRKYTQEEYSALIADPAETEF